MKTTFIVKPDAHGFNNGKEYRGLVIATKGKEKAISFAYIPDTFDELLGMTLAELKLKRKLSRRKQVRIESDITDYENVMACCKRELQKLTGKVFKELETQHNLTNMIKNFSE